MDKCLNVIRRMLDMNVEGEIYKGRPKRRFTDAMKKNMQVVGVEGRCRGH